MVTVSKIIYKNIWKFNLNSFFYSTVVENYNNDLQTRRI